MPSVQLNRGSMMKIKKKRKVKEYTVIFKNPKYGFFSCVVDLDKHYDTNKSVRPPKMFTKQDAIDHVQRAYPTKKQRERFKVKIVHDPVAETALKCQADCSNYFANKGRWKK